METGVNAGDSISHTAKSDIMIVVDVDVFLCK